MKKLLMLVIAVVVVGSLMAAPVLAAGKSSPAGQSNIGHLYLYEKNPADWSIVDGGAWGKFNYKLSVAGVDGVDTTVSGVFNGHGLVADESYSLIYYPETRTTWPWPVVVIGSGTANKGGNVHIKGTATIGGPDSHNDPLDIDYYPDELGDKIWLVLTDDIVGGSLTLWNPTEYLFENNLINTP